MADLKQIEMQCTVPGVDRPNDEGMALMLVVYSDGGDNVRVHVNGQWIRVNAKLLKLAVDHAAETAPKW